MVAGNDITRAGCWAHARRKIVEAEKAAPEIAREAVELIRALYAVEHRGKNLSAAARLELRQADSAPVLAGLKEKIVAWKQQLGPKHRERYVNHRGPYFWLESPARMRRTEVRPILSRRAISDLLTPARYSFRTSAACMAAVAGRPRRFPFFRV